jgi:hypothetical protein
MRLKRRSLFDSGGGKLAAEYLSPGVELGIA